MIPLPPGFEHANDKVPIVFQMRRERDQWRDKCWEAEAKIRQLEGQIEAGREIAKRIDPLKKPSLRLQQGWSELCGVMGWWL